MYRNTIRSQVTRKWVNRNFTSGSENPNGVFLSFSDIFCIEDMIFGSFSSAMWANLRRQFGFFKRLGQCFKSPQRFSHVTRQYSRSRSQRRSPTRRSSRSPRRLNVHEKTTRSPSPRHRKDDGCFNCGEKDHISDRVRGESERDRDLETWL